MGESPIKTLIIIILIGFLIFSYLKPVESQAITLKFGDWIKSLISGFSNKVPTNTATDNLSAQYVTNGGTP